jgi:citrate synthase/citryl-CoA lyase
LSDQSRRKAWRTAIASPEDDRILVRGYDLNELIGRLRFSEMIYLLQRGELASLEQARMIDALLVAVADHGISPSSTVTRFLSASGVPVQVAVAGGLMTFGDIHGGASEAGARLLQHEVARAREEGIALPEAADRTVAEARAAKRPLDGFGHPQHPSGDPRVARLFTIAEATAVAGDHVAFQKLLQASLEKAVGRSIPINIDGAVASIISDLGFDHRYARPFMITARAAGLSAHALEEIDREGGWRQIPLSEVSYDGPPPRPFPATSEG